MNCTDIAVLTACLLLGGACTANSHEDHRTAVTASVAEAGISDTVTVSCTDTHVTLQSDTYPDHELMTGITGTNEQMKVTVLYFAPIILAPALGDTPLTRDAVLGAADGGSIAPGRPPADGVEGIMFSEDADGHRSMEYRYEGEDYFVRYAPSDTRGCYDVETRSATNGGNLQSREYCRDIQR